MINNWIIYFHKNKINNKLYIGITSKDPKVRWHLDGSGYQNQPKFFNAIKKYGWDNFEHSVLIKGLTFEEAKIIEKELIKKYNTKNNGYNSTDGGEGIIGFHHSEETKMKMSLSSMGKDPTNNRPVRCLELQKVFESARQAAKEFNIAPSTITRVCQKIKPTTAGFHWCYEDKYNSNIIIPKMPTRSRKILCLNTNQIFSNASEAAKWCGLSRSGCIHRVCTGERKTSGQHPETKEALTWRYVDE